ncbi:MAG: DNA recombination protein RmuC [Flammeovirgaceae bacterium]|jgi:DNA recombination protein RmuC
MQEIIIFIVGFGGGILVMWFFFGRESRMKEEVYQQTTQKKQEELERMLTGMKETFGSLSQQALSQNTQEFLKLADFAFSQKALSNTKDLDGKKDLIDQSLTGMRGEMQKMQQLIAYFEKDRVEKYGQLSTQLQNTAEQTAKLQEVTNVLKSTLSNTKNRGQWGERMAEDILRMTGMIEGVNYLKQAQVTGHQSKPDFTFLLPNNMKVNMDVKFPFNNYLKYLESEIDGEKKRYKNDFLKDVKLRVKEVTNRNYINPQDNTVDYVLVFIPNEQVYGFIHENETGLLDEALKNKVVLCSPFTLYAILAIIRQAVEHFSMEQKATEILDFMKQFRNEWGKFTENMDKLGRRIEDVQKEYNQLTTTRKRQLDKSLDRIDLLGEVDSGNAKKQSTLFE